MPNDKLGSFGMLKRDTQEEEFEEEQNDGVLFYVNTGGFPVNERTWSRMWNHVGRIHPDGHAAMDKIRDAKHLPDVAVPQPPNLSSCSTVEDKVENLQKYMSELQYNHTGTQFYEIRKNRPISGLMETAKEMIRESLPIKCLEAVILGLYLTREMAMDRFPISFKSSFQGNIHRHVVLGLHYNGKYGALGMSRRDDLMYKPLVFKSLSKLVIDYKRAYEKYLHELKKVKIGWPVSHDCHSYEQILWKRISLTISKTKMDEISRDLDHHAREMRNQSKKADFLQQVYSSQTKIIAPDHRGSPKRQSTNLIKQEKKNNSTSNRTNGLKKTEVIKATNADQYQVRM